MDSSSISTPLAPRKFAQADSDNALIRSIDTSDNKELVEELIEYGANVNATMLNEFGITSTALMLAALKNREQSALALINAGTDVNIENGEGWTALSVAAKEGHLAIVKSLVPHICINNFNNPKSFGAAHPLHEAARKNHLPIVLSLLSQCKIASWNIVSPLSLLDTPLLPISRFSHPAIIEACIDAISQFDSSTLNNVRDNYNNNLMIRAALTKSPAIIHALVFRGADTNSTNNQGQTPLMIAALNGDLGIMSLLIAAKANIEAVDSHGLTVLSERNKPETNYLLLSAMPEDRVNFHKQSTLKNIVTDCIKAVNQFRHEMFHNFFSLGVNAKVKLPKDLIKLIFTFNSNPYPQWYQLRFQNDLEAMSSRVMHVAGSKAEKNPKEKRAGKKCSTAKSFPQKATLTPPSPTFLPIAATLTGSPSHSLPIVDQMAAMTIHTGNKKPTEKKSPKQKKSG